MYIVLYMLVHMYTYTRSSTFLYLKYILRVRGTRYRYTSYSENNVLVYLVQVLYVRARSSGTVRHEYEVQSILVLQYSK